jgi:hypothetical protein
MEKKLSVKQAYVAAFLFLRDFYIRDGKPDNLSILISGMQLVRTEKSWDPAMWSDWEKSVAKALEDDTLADQEKIGL